MKSLKTSFLFLHILIDFIVTPVLIYLYLSIPRFYAWLSFSSWSEQFPSSYVNLNLTLTLLFASLYYILKQFYYKISKIILLLIIQLLLFVRFIDIETKKFFGFSFSPAYFSNLEIESVRIAFEQYWLVVIGFILIVIFVYVVLYKIQFQHKYLKRYKIIATVLFCLIAVRSLVILKKESWHSNFDFATQLFIEQAYDYYIKNNLINDINWKNSEIKIMEELGYSFDKSSTFSDSSEIIKKNLILIYLEGFNAEFTVAGGSTIMDLTPNLDRFALDNMFLGNFYNAVTPTVNSLISSQCGLLPQFNNFSLDRFVYAPSFKCLSDFLHKMKYKQVLMQGSSVGFSGIKKFSEFHKFDEIIGRDKLKELFPKYKTRMTSWGFNDLDLFSAIKSKIAILKHKQPFHLSVLTLDTHPPFDSAPECPKYSNNKKQNAIHCIDFIIGDFLRFIEREQLLLNTIILITGDHRLHGSKTPFGKVYTALYDPDLKNNFPIIKKINTFTPDIAPSILELLGTDFTSMNVGKSFLSLREEYQFLVSPNFTVKENLFNQFKKCPEDKLKDTVINLSSGNLDDCQIAKIDIMYDTWILKGSLEF